MGHAIHVTMYKNVGYQDEDAGFPDAVASPKVTATKFSTWVVEMKRIAANYFQWKPMQESQNTGQLTISVDDSAKIRWVGGMKPKTAYCATALKSSR